MREPPAALARTKKIATFHSRGAKKIGATRGLFFHTLRGWWLARASGLPVFLAFRWLRFKKMPMPQNSKLGESRPCCRRCRAPPPQKKGAPA